MYYKQVIRSTLAWASLWLSSVLVALWILDWPLYWLWDVRFFQEQLGAGLFKTLLYAGLGIIIYGLFEWYFHKYWLHRICTLFLKNWPAPFCWFYRINVEFRNKHQFEHHRVVTGEKYDIMTPEQTASMRFPFWALIGFIGLTFPFLAGLQALPFFSIDDPVVLGGIYAGTISYVAYEVLHALFHADSRIWKKYTELPGWRGIFFTWCYEYHKDHHRDTNTNYSVVLRFPDRLFATRSKRRVLA